jgi:hypothetical protein
MAANLWITQALGREDRLRVGAEGRENRLRVASGAFQVPKNQLRGREDRLRVAEKAGRIGYGSLKKQGG